MAKQIYQNVRGMPDRLPEEFPWFDHVVRTFRGLAQKAGFRPIETPVLEEADLFTRGVGEVTDIVEKEMYVLTDRSDKKLALKPEGTAGVVRAYIQHGMASLPQPVKLHYVSPSFRYDRPQAGRQRQFYQLGLEVLGQSEPSADAQVIALAERLYRELGIRQVRLQINSIGDEVCRPKYREALVNYLEAHRDKLGEECRERLDKNPLRVLDCKEPSCQAVIAAAPQTLDHLCKACNEHFRGVLEYLDELNLAYELNPTLVRGLDYYTRTVFEFYGFREGAQASLGAGGRYDGLAELLGGNPTAAVGFGLGIERIVAELKDQQVALPEPKSDKLFVVSLGEPARLAAFSLIEKLLDAGLYVEGALAKSSIQNQLEKADKAGAAYALIVGQKEVMEQTCILRDMTTGAQETLPLKKVVSELAKRFLNEG